MFRSDLRPSSGGYKLHLYYVHMCLFNYMCSVDHLRFIVQVVSHFLKNHFQKSLLKSLLKTQIKIV
jgi:hypothetical protein